MEPRREVWTTPTRTVLLPHPFWRVIKCTMMAKTMVPLYPHEAGEPEKTS